MTVGRLTKRPQFQRVAARGKSCGRPGLVLQACRRGDETSDRIPRVGFTASRKVGNAVVRNRARRRLRAVAKKVLPVAAPDFDYVLIARRATADRSFGELVGDLEEALTRLGLHRVDAAGAKGSKRKQTGR